MRKLQIGVIGSAGPEEYFQGKPDKKIYQVAEEVGRLVAENGAILVTGGKGGIMEAACRGAKSKGGFTVGIVKGRKRKTSNPYVDAEIVSGMEGYGEEAILVLTCDGLIALGGGAGTLQELAIAYRNKKPVVVIKNLSGWANKLANSHIDQRKIIRFKSARSPKEAVKILLRVINQR